MRLIEFIFEVVAGLIWEICLQVVGEALFELGFHSLGEGFRRRERAHPVLAGVGISLWGGLGGVASSMLWPSRVWTSALLPGASLLLSPLLNGAAMEFYGRWRTRHGGPRSYIATYWGGALFAFSMAVARFVWIE